MSLYSREGVKRTQAAVGSSLSLISALFWFIKVAQNSFQHYIWIGRYNHCLSFDATIMVSKNCPIIGEHVVMIFLTQ